MSQNLKGFGLHERGIYVTHIRNGMQRGAAAEALGLERKKVREYITTHPEFEALIEDAETDAVEHVMEALYQAAINGSVTAAKTWIELKGMSPVADMRPQKAGPVAPAPRGDPFADLDNVSALDHQRRRRTRDGP